MMTRDQIQTILKKSVSFSEGDQTEAILYGGKSYLTGFANNHIHRNVGENNYNLSLRVAFGKKIGSASVNDFSDEAIKNTVKRAVEIAKLQEENPSFVSFAKPEEALEKDFFVEKTAEVTPDMRAEYVKKICDKSKEKGLNANGTFVIDLMQIGVLNSLGISRFGSLTVASLKSVILGDTSSGYSIETSTNVDDISVNSVIEESIGIAEMGKNPIAVEPGKYEVVLSPYAFAEFISSLSYLALNARAVEEGTSFLAGNFGKKILGDNITIYDDGLSPETIPMPFDFEGVSKKKVVFFENGVAKDVVYDTLTAYKNGKESTGHSLPQPSSFSPYPMNIIMKGGDLSKDEIISHVEHGLYVHRFWYTNPMDPRRAVITGMTRDGLFLVENGKITKPVKNMRFTESIITALNNCIELSKEKRVMYDSSSITVPYVRIKDFTFTSITEF
jgi:predicted Zn-dependent protease